MSADIPAAANLQEQPASAMLPIAHQTHNQTASAISSFSYAQAAKGKTQAPPSLPQNGNPSSETNLKRTVSSDRKTGIAEADRNSAKRAASEGHIPTNKGRDDKVEAQVGFLNDNKEDMGIDLSVKPKDEEIQKVTSPPSSPEYGTTSTSTLPKEDDAFSTGNGSSDSTSDKQSQASQNDVILVDKAHSEQQISPDIGPAWDEEAPIAPAFREAPPPTLNIWQQRKEAQDAKARAKQASTAQVKPLNVSGGHGGMQGVIKGTDAINDSKKPDSRRKGKAPPEERVAMDAAKDPNRDAKAKNSSDGTRHRRKIDEIQPGTISTDKQNANAMAPPPPGDAMSWPTPDSSVGEEKKKPQPQQRPDDGEKEKDAPKPLGKKGWTPVPFVPTAVFSTPLPQSRRGGRGPSGGIRDNPPRGRNNAFSSSGVEKLSNSNASITSNSAFTSDRSKANASSFTHGSTISKSKRSSSAGPMSSREQRRLGENAGAEKRKEVSNEENQAGQSKRNFTNEVRRSQGVPIPAVPQVGRASARASNSEQPSTLSSVSNNRNEDDRESQNTVTEPPSQPRGSGVERRSEGSIRPSDLPKDFAGNFPGRERGEERSGRGRGGNRGRGTANHANFNAQSPNGHAYANGQAYHHPPPYTGQARSFSNHERIPSQSHGGFFGSSPQHRTFRSNSRSHYNPSYISANGRFSNGPNSGPAHLPSIQTDLANMSAFQHGPQGIMSAIPYNPYEEQVTLFGMVTMQMEYYFSLDNLCKDMFLRKHMDSQGYVFLSVLAGFNRIVALTTDIELIRYVCFNSQKIEFKPGQLWQDGRDRLRARDNWKNFVLSKDQRDSSAQSDGPTPNSSHSNNESAQGSNDRQSISPRSNPSNGPMEFPYQSLNAIAPSTVHSTDSNSLMNGNYPDTNQPPLSAAVSEFTPSVRSHTGRRLASPDPRSHETKAFTDDDVQHLQILVRQPINSSNPPFHSASSRTFSNGSIDGRNLNDELSSFAERQPRSLNGEVFERWVHD